MLFQNRIDSFKDLPVPYPKQRITDICCCGIGFLFGLICFMIACLSLRSGNMDRVNLPADKHGVVCALDPGVDGQLYPVLYFDDVKSPMPNRYCVKECPQENVPPLCRDGQCSITYYPTHLDEGRLGSFCLPDDQAATTQLYSNSGMGQRQSEYQAFGNVMWGLLISTVLGAVWMGLVQFFPQVMVWVAIILAMVLLLICDIVFMVSSHSVLAQASGWAIFFALVALLFMVILGLYLLFRRRSLKLCGIFLYNSTIMLRQNCLTFIYIPIFMGLTILFCLLMSFQFNAYKSLSNPYFSESQLYYQTTPSPILMVVLVVETLWGLSFLRDACTLYLIYVVDFLVSACAVQWYFDNRVDCFDPPRSLLFKHFGTVVSGAILGAFFYIPDMIVNNLWNDVDCCLCNLFNLVRGDAYPYTYLTGSGYCNSVRQCQYLCERSKVCEGHESTNSVYSLAARLVLAISTVLIVFWMSEDNLQDSVQNPYTLLGAFIIGLFWTCYLVDIHIDVAEALLISFLCEQDIGEDGLKKMNKCKRSIRDEIEKLMQQKE